MAFDNMQSRQLKGTTDWAEYSISLPIHAEAQTLVFGVLLAGTGKAWADDLQLLVDGKPVWEARKTRLKTVLDSDHEFDGGSRIILTNLTKVQLGNLSTLGKVWGFLKYHHPAVTSGHKNWDYELFRVLPAVLAAPDRGAGNVALAHWISGLGEAAECEPCAKLDENNLHLRPNLDWITDEARLGRKLSEALRLIHRNRSTGAQFYVSLVRGVRNPVFHHERSYAEIPIPNSGFQLLGLFRFWNIIQYWFPYRDLLDEDWDGILAAFIPRLVLANSVSEYRLELMALIARAHDTHANLWSALAVRPPVGTCQVPIVVRFIENRAVITGYTPPEAARATGLEIGDIIVDLDGRAVSKWVEEWTPFYAASNDAARLRDIAGSLTQGSCGAITMRVERKGETIELHSERISLTNANSRSLRFHDPPGDAFQLLSDEVAYLKLSEVKASECARYVKDAAGTKGLILDLRNYPSEFVVFSLGSLLVTKRTEFARFTYGDLANPGAFHWTEPVYLEPNKPHYSGKLVVLLDEVSQSQAEYTSMAFRAAGAKIVGNTTAGADGNVSNFALPGGLSSMISGIGVFYPNKKPTQRIGIIPDIEVRPTISGIRARRDEVLEEGLRQILEPPKAAALIEKMRTGSRRSP